jgi:hypothetical protein
MRPSASRELGDRSLHYPSYLQFPFLTFLIPPISPPLQHTTHTTALPSVPQGHSSATRTNSLSSPPPPPTYTHPYPPPSPPPPPLARPPPPSPAWQPARDRHSLVLTADAASLRSASRRTSTDYHTPTHGTSVVSSSFGRHISSLLTNLYSHSYYYPSISYDPSSTPSPPLPLSPLSSSHSPYNHSSHKPPSPPFLFGRLVTSALAPGAATPTTPPRQSRHPP